ncbi:MAG TPA: hypothetical protein VGP36_18100 [Mycobacteriales bacterium]|nr:hypothetical protein [Mycobacteriales bacterium]
MVALSAVERRLVDAVTAGEQLDLRTAEEREIRAGLVRDVLLGAHGRVDARGLQLRGATLTGTLDLDGLHTTARVRLRDCVLPTGAVLRGAALPMLDLGGCTVSGLLADDLVVDGSVLLWRGFTANGLVSFVGARIGGKLDLTHARLAGGSGGAALVADRITLGGDLLLDDAVGTGGAVAGTLQLVGARVAGRLSARRIWLTNPAGPGLNAANLHVTDMVDLSRGIEVHGAGPDGAVRLVGARVGSMSLGRARLENPSGWALSAHYLDVGGTLYLDRITAVGGLRLSGSRVGGQIDLHETEVDGGERSAIAGLRLQVAQGVLLDGARLTAAGTDPTLNLRSTRIAGDLEMRGTRVSHPSGTAIRLNTATVEGRVAMSETEIESGELDLRDSSVGTLYDDPARAKGAVEVNGLTYRGMPGHPGVTVEQRLRWLERMPAYAAQPYRQLSAAYQGAGHEDEARRVLVAQQSHLHRTLTGWSRTRHRWFGLTLQYGYQPGRAVALLIAVLGVAIGLFLSLGGGTQLPAGGPCPVVDRVGLAVDAAIPLVSTGAADRCQLATATGAGQALAAAGWILTLLGWASATLVVAGYSGWVRRR